MKVLYSLRRTNKKGYFVDFRVIKKGNDFISQFKPKGDRTWARLSLHISLKSAVNRINE